MKYNRMQGARFSSLNKIVYESKPYLIGFIGLWLLKSSEIGTSALGKGSSLLLISAAFFIIYLRYTNRTSKRQF